MGQDPNLPVPVCASGPPARSWQAHPRWRLGRSRKAPGSTGGVTIGDARPRPRRKARPSGAPARGGEGPTDSVCRESKARRPHTRPSSWDGPSRGPRLRDSRRGPLEAGNGLGPWGGADGLLPALRRRSRGRGGGHPRGGVIGSSPNHCMNEVRVAGCVRSQFGAAYIARRVHGSCLSSAGLGNCEAGVQTCAGPP